MLRFYVGTVEIKWNNIPAKQFVKIRSPCPGGKILQEATKYRLRV
jgi:hypothetical protein